VGGTACPATFVGGDECAVVGGVVGDVVVDELQPLHQQGLAEM